MHLRTVRPSPWIHKKVKDSIDLTTEPTTPLNDGRGFANVFASTGRKCFQQRPRVVPPTSVSPVRHIPMPNFSLVGRSSECGVHARVSSYVSVSGVTSNTSNTKVFEELFNDTLPGAVTYNTFAAVSTLVEKVRIALVRLVIDDDELFLQLSEHLDTLASELEEGSDQRLSRESESHMF